MRERDVLDLLNIRYPTTSDGIMPPRFILIEHPNAGAVTGDDHALRSLDALVLDRYLTGGIRPVHGFEIKTTRADWLRELATPEKSAAWVRYCHRFWIVTGGPGIVKKEELPPGWGLMTARDGALAIEKPARTNRDAQPLPGIPDLVWRAIKTDRERRRR